MDLSIDYNQTRQIGNSILEKGNDFSEVLNKITSENENLRNSWKGSDAEKYTSAVAAEIENMKVLNKTICEMGEFLISAANAYQKVNEANQDGIR
ncbi:unknown [Clostridium sp. CAG:433]|nr:unknown [Clostridium sp. CAG:433]